MPRHATHLPVPALTEDVETFVDLQHARCWHEIEVQMADDGLTVVEFPAWLGSSHCTYMRRRLVERFEGGRH